MRNFLKQQITPFLLLVLLAGLFSYPHKAKAQLSLIRNITFPIIGTASFSDDFADPRSGGRTHEGNDIFGRKMQSLVAAVDGTLDYVVYPEASWGYSISIKDKDGYEYNYLHMNNDAPGTDNGTGDGMFAYAPDMARGNPVVAGQLIGYMGDSGNAETTSPHLHFEIRTPDGQAFSPYESLIRATKLSAPVPSYPALPGEILPYENFTGGAALAVGNLDSDADNEIITGAGAGGGSLVRAFDKNGTALGSFYAYDQTFRGGVDVAAGDIDGDGKAEIITAPGLGGGPHVRVLRLDGSSVAEFMAYDSRFHGGVYVSSADVTGDGKAEIITAPRKGGGPHVKVFSGTGVLLYEFLAYAGNFYGGVDVSAAAKTTSSPAIIATAPGQGGGPHIKIYQLNPAPTLGSEFLAYEGDYNLGVRVAAFLSSGSVSQNVATIPATGGGPHLKIFNNTGQNIFSGLPSFEPWWRGGYDIAGSGSDIFLASQDGRRTSVRSRDFRAGNSSDSSDSERRTRRNRRQQE